MANESFQSLREERGRERERFVCVFARNLSICVLVFVCLLDWWSVVWVFVWDAGRGLTAVCVAVSWLA